MKTNLLTLALALPSIFISCTREATGIFEGEVLRQFTIPMAAANVNPAPGGRTETGTLTLQVMSDNSLRYEFSLKGLSGDALSGAQLRSGDALTNGPVVLDLSPRLASPVGSGILFNIRQSLIDSLLNDNTQLYLNISTSTLASGVARGQLRNPVVLAADVALSGTNEVPAVTTTAKGAALIRITADKIMYSQVTVTNVETNDALTAAHIHKGATGVNGSIIADLAKSGADFGQKKTTILDSATYSNLTTEPGLYVNVHSTRNPAGKIRGQIR